MSLFGFIYSYFASIYHFGPDLALFVYIFQYIALHNYIYQHSVIFTLNSYNLTIYTIFTLHLQVFCKWGCTSAQNWEIIYDLASRKSYLFIICPISHAKLTKSHYVSLFGFIYSYLAPIYHFGPYLALFIYFLYWTLLNYIYPHLVIFTLNSPNLTIYAIFALHL